MNFDAAIDKMMGMGMGIIARNDVGEVMFSMCVNKSFFGQPKLVEGLVLTRVVELCFELNVTNALFKIDNFYYKNQGASVDINEDNAGKYKTMSCASYNWPHVSTLQEIGYFPSLTLVAKNPMNHYKNSFPTYFCSFAFSQRTKMIVLKRLFSNNA